MNDYDIIAARTPVQLRDAVRAAIQRGWEPCGGPFQNKDAEEWCQALMRRAAASNGADLRLREEKSKLSLRRS